MKQKLIIILVGLIGSMVMIAQNNTNSPYTRYGYGQLEDDCFSRSQAMGGTSIGLRTKNAINSTNPASYSSIDSTSFIFEMGVSGLLSNFRSGGAQNTSFTGNLDYIALQSPITKWMGLSAGLIPYSYVGYNYKYTDSIQIPFEEEYNVYDKTYYGTGGISQMYLGLSFDIADHLALGVNGYYMFGNINHYKAVSYNQSELTTTNTVMLSNLYIRSFNARFGLQYHETIGEKHKFNIGAIYEFRSGMNGRFEQTTTGTDTLKMNSSELFEMPSLYGGGVTYTYDDRLIIGADFMYQEYSKALYYGKRDTLANRMKISLGAEYTHDPRGRKYVDRMSWRLGAKYNSSYATVNGRQAGDFSITCGLGLPLRTSKTIINVNFEYGNIGGMMATLKENYFKFGLNFSLNETWFVKTKVR
jgi:hypothetical protein